MDTSDIGAVPASKILSKVIYNTLQSLLFYGIGAIIIWLISNSLHALAVVLLIIFIIILAIDGIWQIFTGLVPALIVLPMAIKEALKGNFKHLKEWPILSLATIVRIIELLLLSFVAYKLYIFIFAVQLS